MNDPELCKKLLLGLDYMTTGFCRVSKMVPSKENGYVQLSAGGANKFAMLQEVLLWSKGDVLGAGEQCSHLCGNPLCLCPEHIIKESARANNNRKGCVAVDPFPCAHCNKLYLRCVHEPKCIAYVPGWQSWEDYIENGEYHYIKNGKYH